MGAPLIWFGNNAKLLPHGTIVDYLGNPLFASYALENVYVTSLRFVLIGSGTSGSIMLPPNSTIMHDAFEGTSDAVVTGVSNSRPSTFNVSTAMGVVVAALLDSAGNWAFTGTPSSYPVALVYSVRQKLSDFDSDAGDICQILFLQPSTTGQGFFLQDITVTSPLQTLDVVTSVSIADATKAVWQLRDQNWNEVIGTVFATSSAGVTITANPPLDPGIYQLVGITAQPGSYKIQNSAHSVVLASPTATHSVDVSADIPDPTKGVWQLRDSAGIELAGTVVPNSAGTVTLSAVPSLPAGTYKLTGIGMVSTKSTVQSAITTVILASPSESYPVDVSSYVTNAQNSFWQLRDSNGAEVYGVTSPADAGTVDLVAVPALPAGTYSLIGIEGST